MHRSIGSSAKKIRRHSWFIVPGLIVVLLSLFVSIFSGVGARAHAAIRSPLTNGSGTEFIRNHLNGYHAKDMHSLANQAAHISDLSLHRQPALMLTRTSLPDTTFHGKQDIEYVLAVSNSHSAGPVVAGNTITISNVIPAGVTGLTTHTRNSDWKVKLSSKTGPTILTATYVGAYPVLAGAILSPIIVRGVLEHFKSHHLLIPAIVRILHTNSSQKGKQQTLQQQSAHDFSVQGGTTPKVISSNASISSSSILNGSPPAATAPKVATPVGTAPKVATPGGTPPASTAPRVATPTATAPKVATPGGTPPAATAPRVATPRGTPPAATAPKVATPRGTPPKVATPRGTPPAATAPRVATPTATAPKVATPRGTPPAATAPKVATPGGTAPKVATPRGTPPRITTPNGITPFSVTPTPSATYQGGQTVIYTLGVTNSSSAGPVILGDSITVTDNIPAGLSNLTASASTSSDWSVSLGGPTSPTTLTATYTGSYPVAAGATLSSITITGTLNSSATPTLTNTAVVVTPNDSNNTNNSGTNLINVLAQPDLTVTDPQPSGTYEVGKPVTYTITGSNVSGSGPVTSDSITITDTLPAGLSGITYSAPGSWSFVLSPSSGTSPATLTATYNGTYPVNGGTTLPIITVTGTLTSPAVSSLANSATISTAKDINSANNTASNTIAVSPQPDMTVTKTYPAGTYQVGLPVTYTITASNLSGSGPVLTGDPITITDNIPTGLTGITYSANSSIWNVTTVPGSTSPTTLVANYVGTYPVNANTTLAAITISGTLTTSSATSFVNTATVTTPNDGNTANNSGTSTLPVLTVPDLTVTDPQPSGTYEVGKPVTYTVTGSNLSSAGPVLAGDPITITDFMPTGLTGITYSAPSGWTLSLSPSSGTSPATLTATYTGTYPVNPGATLPVITINGTLTSSAQTSLANSAGINTPKDTDTANNTANNTIAVAPQPDLSLTKTIPATGSLQVGHSVTYALTATNGSSAGPILTGDSIVIADSIPAGFTNLSASGTSWTITLSPTSGPSPTTMTATYGGTYPVAPGTALPTISLTGTLTSAAYSSVINSATVTTPNDGNSANNTASLTSPVLLAPDLSLTKTVALAPGSLVRGQQVQGKRFRSAIGVKNANQAGPVLADDPITVIDQLPASATALVTSTNHKYWHTKLEHTKNGTTLVATYVGPHPVLAGTNLPLIVVNGVTTERSTPQFANAVVITTTQHRTQNKRTNSKTNSVVQKAVLSLDSSGTLTPTYQGGQQVTYKLTVSNSSKAGPVIKGDPIVMVDKIPGGLTALNASANRTYWLTKLTAITSPTTLTATYVGPYPVAAGTRLPAIMLNGTLTGATSQLTNTASVKTPDDSGTTKTNGHTGTTTIKVIPAPDMAITKTNFGGHVFYPGQQVQYVLHIRSTNLSGPINASVPIHVTDALPIGAYHVKAYGNGWNIRIQQTAHGTLVMARYAGHYPIMANTSLPSIIVDSRVKGRTGNKLVNIAQVTLPYDSHPNNNVARDTIMIHAPALPPTGSNPDA